MRDALSNVLGEEDAEESVTRILAAAFFRKRPLQAGSSAHVVPLADRKSSREGCDGPSFLQGGQRR
jgi:hypothetical protein